MVAGVLVLATRQNRVSDILRRNGPILIYLGYCGLSSLWSDYTFVSFKRWTKEVGDFVMVLVILTEPNRLNAIKQILTRVSFILLPISIMLCKYYPNMGVTYDKWYGTPMFIGVSIHKNLLGMLCLLMGNGVFWMCLETFRKEQRFQRIKKLSGYGAVLGMTIWLLWTAGSATSSSCFGMMSMLMLAVTVSKTARQPLVLNLMIGAIVLGTVITLFGAPAGGALLASIGRDPTLTGRTEIWGVLLKIASNPILGTGFETFWLGDRLKKVWVMAQVINEAHNGYLEVYLNLGAIGVMMLAMILISGYRNVLVAFRRDGDFGKLRLIYFVTVLVYNLTEAAFKELNPMWFFFLLSITIVPIAPAQPRILAADKNAESRQDQSALQPAAKEL